MRGWVIIPGMTRSVLVASLVLLGCAGAPSADGQNGADTAGGDEPAACDPDATRLGASCWSAAGTSWQISAEGPGGEYRFEVVLLAAGRVRSTDHEHAAPGRDEWTQDGPLLRIFLSDRFVEYRTRVTNGTVLVGEAVSVRGQRWAWRGDRVFGGAACTDGEARIDESCLAIAGTRWSLGGAVVEFLEGGRVAVGAAQEAAGTWEQSGAALRFALGEGEPTHVVELTSPSTLSGTFEGRGGTWTAERVISVPPVMHE